MRVIRQMRTGGARLWSAGPRDTSGVNTQFRGVAGRISTASEMFGTS